MNMRSTGSGEVTSKSKTSKSKSHLLAHVAFAICVFSAGGALAATSGFDIGSVKLTQPTELTPEVRKLLDDADAATKAGNFNLALIQLKNAVRLAPKSGEARGRLGTMILGTGQVVAAERELRQALTDGGPTDLIVPPLVRAMIQRKEMNELLAQFPDPSQGTQDKAAPDIFIARAIALQALARPKEARTAMDRSLALRRDTGGLVNSAGLARQQNDLALARSNTDEALKLSPNDEGALISTVVVARQGGDDKKALANADEFIKRVPKSVTAKILRIELLLDSKQDGLAKQETDALLKQSPNLAYGHYFRGVLMARAKDPKGGWRELQNLSPEFIQSEPQIAIMISSIAVASGNLDTGGAILTKLLSNQPDNRVARLQLASIRLTQNAPQGALDTLAPLKAANDPIVQGILAQAYLRLRRFNEAVAALEIANSSPNSNDLLKRQLALSQMQVGEQAQAIQGLQDLNKRDPGNPNVAGPLIAALVSTSKWNEALTVADGMAKREPKSALPAFYRGQIFIGQGKLAEASTAFGSALALDPKFLPALSYRADVSLARGRPEDAKKDLELILVQDQANTAAYIKLIQIATQNGQDQEVLAGINRAVKAVPKDPAPRLALARYQYTHGKQKDALATVNDLLLVSKSNTEAQVLLGEIQFSNGQAADGIKTFRALAAANASPDTYRLLARALYATKNQSAAEEAAKRAVDLGADSASTQMELINIQIGAGKGDAALTTAQSYARAYPGTEADLLVAETLVQLKRQTEAEALLDKSLAAKPDGRVTMRVAQMALVAGNSKKAVATLSNWVTKHPEDFGMEREYASTLMGTGDVAEARKEYEKLLKLHPEDPIILNNLGYLLQKENPERALSLVSLAQKIAPQSPQISDTLGWIKYQRKDHQGALPLLQRAHVEDANSPAISYHLALVLDATGKRAEAKTLLQTALAKNPKFEGSDDAKQTLAKW
jgi:putative PEP-CTERM system TPR-repeat lipoprotein